MVNKVILIGRLGGDPVVRYTQNELPVASFSIACTEKWTDQSGQKHERTEWVKIQVWRKLAELCAQYLKKGSLAYFEGKLVTRQWEKDGEKRYSTEVVADIVRFLDSRSSSNGEQHEEAPEPGMFG